MKSLFHYLAPPSQCGYLPNQIWRLEYEHVASLSPDEYMRRLLEGWRRFGNVLFRPRCQSCIACRSLRVVVDRFQPNRSQRRAWKNNDSVELRIGSPSVSRAKLELYSRYHAYQSEAKGWPGHSGTADEYSASFVENPFPTQEWCYYRGAKLIGVGYVDDLPGGLSAIYFFYDPTERAQSPGTANVLQILREAKTRAIPYVYLGYYVADCPSMTYKSYFSPNQILRPDGRWEDFRV
jgi:arginine-tRNA-protein transferase